MNYDFNHAEEFLHEWQDWDSQREYLLYWDSLIKKEVCSLFDPENFIYIDKVSGETELDAVQLALAHHARELETQRNRTDSEVARVRAAMEQDKKEQAKKAAIERERVAQRYRAAFWRERDYS